MMTSTERAKLERAEHEAFANMILSVAFSLVATGFAVFTVWREMTCR